MDAVLERKLLGLLGLGVRGRLAVIGVEQVRNAAQRGVLHFAVLAPDASHNSLDKVRPMLEAKRIRFIEGPSASALGAAVGRQATAVVGIVDPQLAKGVRALVESGPARAQ
jgi:ribosomal protein L7Ae-like RNA K-turn-binding protein